MNNQLPILELVCIKCDKLKPIPQKFRFKTNICIDCRNQKQKEYQLIYREGRKAETVGVSSGRRPYPLEDCYKSTHLKFRKLASQINKIKDRDTWRKLISDRLDYVANNPALYKWIIDHQSNEVTKKKSPDWEREENWDESKRGPKIKMKYPSTKDMEF